MGGMVATKKLGDYLGVLGNLGLILGLFLVGYQIKQTNDLAKAQMVNESYALATAADLAIIGEQGAEVLAKADYQSSDLSDQDILVLERLFRVLLGQQMRNVYMRESGLAGVSEAWGASDTAFEFNNAFGRMYWDISKNDVNLTRSFIAEVDRNFSIRESQPNKIDFYRGELDKRQP
jgi:hypothetical protein